MGWRMTGRRMSRLFLGLVLALLLAELGLNAYLAYFARAGVFDYYASIRALKRRYGDDFFETRSRYAPHRYLGYYPTPEYRGPGGDRHNALGYRGEEVATPKPPGVLRLAVLGGSTVYSFGVDHYARSFPHLLQEELRGRGHPEVEVVNAGASSYSTWESLVNLEFRVLDLEPDLVVVYHGTNDAALRLVWPPDAYRGDNSGAKIALSVPRARARDGLFELSTLLRILALRMDWTTSNASLARDFDRRAETYRSDDLVRQLALGEYPAGWFEEVDAETVLASNPPVYFERNLRNVAAVAEASGVRCVLATFAYSNEFPENPRVAHGVYRAAMEEGNAIVRAVAADTPAHLFDFAAVMPRDRRYYTDGRHFTEAGNRLRARLFADELIGAGLLSGHGR